MKGSEKQSFNLRSKNFSGWVTATLAAVLNYD